MKLNKIVLTGVAALTVFSASAALANVQNQTTTVEAATSKKKLTHNAAIYDSKGKRVKKAKTLKKGKSIKVLGYKTIKGKKYARVGKNQYVKMSNFKKVTKKKTTSKKIKKTTTSNTKKTTATSTKSDDPMINKYQAWLDERDDGAMVAIRDTQFYPMYNYSNYSTAIPKGTMITIDDDDEDEDSYAGVIKGKDGQYYIQLSGPDDVIDYPAADFTFNAYKKTSEYKNLVKKYVFDEDKYDHAEVTLSGPAYYYGDEDDEPVYKTGEKFSIEDPDITLNEDGSYSLLCSDNDGTSIEIPIKNISSYKLISSDEDDE